MPLDDLDWADTVLVHWVVEESTLSGHWSPPHDFCFSSVVDFAWRLLSTDAVFGDNLF